jgi:hypothetical protein
MKTTNKIMVTIIVLAVIFISVIFSLAELELIETYIPLDIGSYDMSLGVASVASYEVSGVPVTFAGDLAPASNNNPATTTVDILNTGNIDLKVDISGAPNFEHDINPSTYYFSINNAKWNTLNDAGTSTPLTTTYAQVQSSLSPGNTQNIYLWVDIPVNQYAGSYNSTVYIQVTI